MKKNILMLLLGTILASSSCNKKDDSSSTSTPIYDPQVKIDFLTTGNWKITGLSINPAVDRGGQMVTDLMPELSSWNKDNTRLFIANGSGIQDEGPTKLSQTDPQIIPLLWSFNSDQTKFTLSILEPSRTYTYSYDMLQLDASTLKYTYPEDGSKVGGIPGNTYVYTLTYGH
ncbi:MAG: hypothetical protein ACOVO9_11360 [Bacteroidia bacterium]